MNRTQIIERVKAVRSSGGGSFRIIQPEGIIHAGKDDPYTEFVDAVSESTTDSAIESLVDRRLSA